jgi:predicted nucleic acid-binding protein
MINRRDTSPIEAIRRTKPDRVAISVIVYGEVQTGIVYSPRRLDDSERWERIVRGFDILDVTQEIADTWALLRGRLRRTGITVGDNDLLIAASALQHEMIVVTRNLRHFSHVPGLSLLVPEF